MTMTKDQEPPARPSPPPPLSAPQNTDIQSETLSSMFSQRSRRQLSIFFAGAAFMGLATIITRRAITRKRLATIPRYFTPSNLLAPKLKGDSSMIAFEALSLATLHVMGFGIVLTGGASWAFDLSNVEDLREMARVSTKNSSGSMSAEQEKEIEEMVSKWLATSDETPYLIRACLPKDLKEKKDDGKFSEE